MDLSDVPDASVVTVVGASALTVVALVLAFQGPVCAQGPDGTCSPNVVFLLLATVAAAVAALTFGYARGLGTGTESE